MNYRLAPGVAIEERGAEGFLLTTRPLRMVRLNRPLLQLARRMAKESVAPASPAEAKVLETLAKGGFVRREWPALAEDALPLVSIVIPVKDRAAELRDCLHSLLALDYPAEKREIIVVDDGSTDDTARVARSSVPRSSPPGPSAAAPPPPATAARRWPKGRSSPLSIRTAPPRKRGCASCCRSSPARASPPSAALSTACTRPVPSIATKR